MLPSHSFDLMETNQNIMNEFPEKVYEVYEENPGTGDKVLIGILPERRKNPSRTTKESVLNWGRLLMGDKAKTSDISFIEISLQKTKTGIFWSATENSVKNLTKLCLH